MAIRKNKTAEETQKIVKKAESLNKNKDSRRRVKHEFKVSHIRKKQDVRNHEKYREEFRIPESIENYKELEIMNIKSMEEENKKETGEETREVMSVGVELSKAEEAVLKLPPNYALNPKLTELDFREQLELAHTKVRYAAMDDPEPGDPEQQDLTSEEEQVVKKESAKSEVIYCQQ